LHYLHALLLKLIKKIDFLKSNFYLFRNSNIAK